VVRVPTEVVREFKTGYRTGQDWRNLASREKSAGWRIDFEARAVAAEFDLPPERVPVTPETPWGTKVVSPYGTRYLFMGTDPWDELTDDGRPRRFWVREQGMNPMDFNLGTDGWFEVERP
jgi:hypothetical protein